MPVVTAENPRETLNWTVPAGFGFFSNTCVSRLGCCSVTGASLSPFNSRPRAIGSCPQAEMSRIIHLSNMDPIRTNAFALGGALDPPPNFFMNLARRPSSSVVVNTSKHCNSSPQGLKKMCWNVLRNSWSQATFDIAAVRLETASIGGSTQLIQGPPKVTIA